MENDEQVAAYSEAGRIDGVMAASYLFNSAHASAVIQGSRTVVDLGCGPATQLAQIAQLNPQIQFHGIDLSPTMLETAERHVRSLGLSNVRFTRGDITALGFLGNSSIDAVISTVTLHHLPTLGHLRACFREVKRILRAGGALYLVDFGRLKQLKSVLFFAYMNAKAQPHVFSLDYERSLRAAFLFDEFKQLCDEELPADARVAATFLSPMLTVIHTEPKPLDEQLRERLKVMRRALPRRYRADLDDLRLFLRLGGLRGDPFR
ncbi:MAG: class I SAM-dependent methyltransferase [Betaproteobacteria bacterium]|nr:class I SAM-dependent methyltransferase [Betaproteobacteria bacterium]